MRAEQQDTIAAICTAPGEAGVAIVRVSGCNALAVADTVFRVTGEKPSQRRGGTFVHGFVTAGDGRDVDEAVLLIYRAPHSYTREDVVEFQGHGGRTCAARILRTVLDHGARLAEPGEFTRRAFLSGRVDLLQAEAVADLIRARSDRAAAAAVEQLEGGLSGACNAVYDHLLAVAADLEATLDFEEEELPDVVVDEIERRLQEGGRRLKALLATFAEGRILREGAMVVISGQPNVGKSTLLNALLGTERAIVTDVAGTTRDTIEEQVVIDGIPLRLVDTAGIRQTECQIEQAGIDRAHASIGRADVLLHILDASRAMDADDRARLSACDPAHTLVIMNKCDIAQVTTAQQVTGFRALSCALVHGDGVEAIRRAIPELLHIDAAPTPHAAISERHREKIHDALNVVNEASRQLAEGHDSATALAASSLRTALESLGGVTGRSYDTELLDNIFSRFCIGK